MLDKKEVAKGIFRTEIIRVWDDSAVLLVP